MICDRLNDGSQKPAPKRSASPQRCKLNTSLAAARLQHDASGNYSMEAPQNDPPHTVPYDICVIPPPGYFATSPTDIGSQWVQGGVTYTGKNFGMATFQVISLNASRVLSLASGDLL